MVFIISGHRAVGHTLFLGVRFVSSELSAAGHEASHLVGKACGIWAREAWFMKTEVAGNAVYSPCDMLSSA